MTGFTLKPRQEGIILQGDSSFIALSVKINNLFMVSVCSSSNRELKHATFLSHGRQPEGCCFLI